MNKRLKISVRPVDILSLTHQVSAGSKSCAQNVHKMTSEDRPVLTPTDWQGKSNYRNGRY
jgi:hypothetical protein